MQTYDNIRSLQISDTPHVVSVTNIRNRKGVFFFLYIRGNEQQVAVRQITAHCRILGNAGVLAVKGGMGRYSRHI